MEINSVTMALIDQSKTFNAQIVRLEEKLKVKIVELSRMEDFSKVESGEDQESLQRASSGCDL